MICPRRSLTAKALCCATVVTFLIGPARADEFCTEVTALVGQATSDVVRELDADALTALSGADDCSLSDNLDGTRSYHCMWEYAYRHPEAYAQFEKMNQSLRACFAGDATELRDQPVNHPDFYDQISFKIEGVEIAVSIKDKSALQKTFTFIRIHSVGP